jgi:DNA-binding NarL/FixJ family response regulator
MPTGAVSVLVVDDQAPFRSAARMVVRATRGFDVIAEAQSGEEALEKVELLQPDLVLMDINMPGIGGIAATRRISSEHPAARVILLSTYDKDDLPADARTAGALAYVHKESFGPDILEEIWAKRPTDQP